METIHLLDKKIQKETADAPKKTTRHDKKKSGHTFPEKVVSVVDVVMNEINLSSVILRAGNGKAEIDSVDGLVNSDQLYSDDSIELIGTMTDSGLVSTIFSNF